MEQKSPDELLGGERHDALALAISIILPAETDLAILDGEESVVGNGDTMRVAPDVVEDLLWAGEGWLRIDDPFRFSNGSQVPLERDTFVKVLQGREEPQLAGQKRPFQIHEK